MYIINVIIAGVTSRIPSNPKFENAPSYGNIGATLFFESCGESQLQPKYPIAQA